MDCIFCKIANRQIESSLIYENDEIVAFPDIRPKASVHILIVPKTHIASVKELESGEFAGKMVMAAREIAKEKKLEGYKLLFNVGREGGQEVDHIHLHLMSAK